MSYTLPLTHTSPIQNKGFNVVEKRRMDLAQSKN
jgi:hypothetical protein